MKPTNKLLLAEQALQVNPKTLEGYVRLGTLHRSIGNLAKAIEYFTQALNLNPTDPILHGLLMEAQLYSGNLHDGFIELEWRKQRPEKKKIHDQFTSLPQWQGELFSGKKLLVYCEEGLGDTLQFVRYLPLVKARGGHVTLACQEPLVRLLTTMPSADSVVNSCNLQDYDIAVALLSLPMIFGTTLNTIPHTVPYITAPETIINHWNHYITPTPHHKVGLVWGGNKNTFTNRSCPIQELAPLAKVAGTTYYSLQKGPDAEQLSVAPAALPIVDLAKYIEDFADTAGAIKNLDLIISIDTSVAHLSAALGKPTWIALPHDNEWRWLSNREDSPWYPTVRLFRQQTEGDWNSVFARMAEEL